MSVEMHESILRKSLSVTSYSYFGKRIIMCLVYVILLDIHVQSMENLWGL
jgi:hypothetical protein